MRTINLRRWNGQKARRNTDLPSAWMQRYLRDSCRLRHAHVGALMRGTFGRTGGELSAERGDREGEKFLIVKRVQ